MSKSGLKKTGAWKKLKNLLNKGKFEKRLIAQIRKAGNLAGLLAVREVRKRIQDGKYERNAALTIAMKGSTKPLVEHGDLFQSVTKKLTKWNEVFIGVLKGNKNFRIAKALHEGFDQEITMQMRSLFFRLWLVSIGAVEPSKGLTSKRAVELWNKYRDWKPIPWEATVIHTPPRKFISSVLEDDEFIAGVKAIWEKTLQKALEGEK